MLKALVALCTLVDIMRYSMSRTTIDVGRCSQCSPSNVYQEVDDAETSQVQEHRGEEDVDRQ